MKRKGVDIIMKESISCEIVQDLLPNYIEGILSNESKELVSKHLDNCVYCKKEHESMTSVIHLDSFEERRINYLKGIHKKSASILLLCIILSIITFIISVFYSEANLGEGFFTLTLFFILMIIIIIRFLLPLLGAIVSILWYKKTKKKWMIPIFVICVCLFIYSLVYVINNIIKY